uniref:Small nuclear ribonucleoprotein E n=1 Tax=Oryza barthii TaxID=65489 RepID=A0A0D3GWD6_9ORYZ
MASTKVQRIMTQPIKARIQIWLFEQKDLRIEGRIIGFDEYMNLVLDDAEEINVKKDTRKSLGRILLKGDNITLMMNTDMPDSSPAWAIDCIPAAGAEAETSAFEVYVAGCCAGEPAVLTCALRLATPEEQKAAGGLVRRRSPTSNAAGDEDVNGSIQHPEGWYSDDDDGQLTWFNAGVRVGVGIGLGVCVGVGIGVGLLMSSYQATARSLKRRFF